MKASLTVWVIAACAALFVGCEGGSSGPSHDFGENDPKLYIAIGDSITEGLGTPGYPAYLGLLLGVPVENRGAAGTTSGDGVNAAERALRRKPGYLLIDYGTNDMLFGRDPEFALANLRYTVAIARENQTVPVIATLIPAIGPRAFAADRMRRLNEGIRTMAQEEGARLVDLEREFEGRPELLQEDGLHPTAEGEDRIARAFRGRL